MFTIDDIIATLEGIEVKGRDNLNRLLSAILALEAMKEATNKTKVAEDAKTEAEGE